MPNESKEPKFKFTKEDIANDKKALTIILCSIAVVSFIVVSVISFNSLFGGEEDTASNDITAAEVTYENKEVDK